jgi:hypothetical protein
MAPWRLPAILLTAQTRGVKAAARGHHSGAVVTDDFPPEA